MKRKRQLVFSVMAKDCKFQATTGSGPGGQHRNKVATAIRCTHTASGATGYASDDKSQHRNKRVAFRRMANSAVFQAWVRIEVARRTGETARLEQKVAQLMSEDNIKCEVQFEGKWTQQEAGGE